VTSQDIKYANGNKSVGPGVPETLSGDHRRVFDMAKSAENKQRLVEVLQVVRSTYVDRIRTDTCNCWVFHAASRIAKLGPEYWDSNQNGEFDIEQVEFDVPPAWAPAIEHAMLRLTFKDGSVVYFDNGAVGRKSSLTGLSIIGGVAFAEDVPPELEPRDKDAGLDEIKPLPDRFSGLFNILFQ
jgi:hypothetical protein